MTKKSLASRLRFRITIEVQVKIPDNMGGTNIMWESVAFVSAEFKSLHNNQMIGSEAFFAGQLASNAYYSFTIRAHKEINHDMRIKLQKRCFDIKKIIDEGRGCLTIIAQEKFN